MVFDKNTFKYTNTLEYSVVVFKKLVYLIQHNICCHYSESDEVNSSNYSSLSCVVQSSTQKMTQNTQFWISQMQALENIPTLMAKNGFQKQALNKQIMY